MGKVERHSLRTRVRTLVFLIVGGLFVKAGCRGMGLGKQRQADPSVGLISHTSLLVRMKTSLCLENQSINQSIGPRVSEMNRVPGTTGTHPSCQCILGRVGLLAPSSGRVEATGCLRNLLSVRALWG